MTYSLRGFLVLTMVLVGGGCSPAASPTANTSDASSESTQSAVAFSTLRANILDSKTTYKEYRFEHGNGDCIAQGLPESFSYLEDPTLKYFIVKSGDGTYTDKTATATAGNRIIFDGLNIGGKSASCTVYAEFGQDTATATCAVEKNDVCTAIFSVVAIPR